MFHIKTLILKMYKLLKMSKNVIKFFKIFQTLLAKALYDNIADTPEELAFKRGDVLTVLEQDTNGLEGWWLCALRGKRGIVPGNRLKVVKNQSENRDSQGVNWKRRSWLVNPNKVNETFVFTC